MSHDELSTAISEIEQRSVLTDYYENRAQVRDDHLFLCAKIRALTEPQPAPPAEPSAPTVGNLWLCYHALKMSEWENVNDEEHNCAYCGQHQSVGHHKDCMIGNALKWMSAAPSPAISEEEVARFAVNHYNGWCVERVGVQAETGGQFIHNLFNFGEDQRSALYVAGQCNAAIREVSGPLREQLAHAVSCMDRSCKQCNELQRALQPGQKDGSK